MQVIPAIDLRDGRCVRLRQGDYARETVFSDDPALTARRWVDEGAEFLHLVDLDGAKAGRPVNTDVIARIVREANIPCQLGGGLRTKAGIEEALSLGIERAIIGTQAVRDPEWFEEMAREFPDRLVLGLDAKDGRVATEGWLETSSLGVREVVERFNPLPLAAIVYTDIAKDGMMSGPNVEATALLAEWARAPVIASGGVTTIEDVLELASRGIGACILGRTIYEGKIKLPALIDRLRQAGC